MYGAHLTLIKQVFSFFPSNFNEVGLHAYLVAEYFLVCDGDLCYNKDYVINVRR